MLTRKDLKHFYDSVKHDDPIDFSAYSKLGFGGNIYDDGDRYGIYQNLFIYQGLSFDDFVKCYYYGLINNLFDKRYDNDGCFMSVYFNENKDDDTLKKRKCAYAVRFKELKWGLIIDEKASLENKEKYEIPSVIKLPSLFP